MSIFDEIISTLIGCGDSMHSNQLELDEAVATLAPRRSGPDRTNEEV